MASDNEASCESDPNFAVICAFMEKFGPTCGLANVDFLVLQEMLENTQEVSQELIDLHIKLLRKSRKSVSNERWEKAIIKFCYTFCNQDAWEIERFGYKKARLSSKLRILKELLEMQFDYNTKFKTEINKMSADELRSQPLGKDKFGHLYWYQNDSNCQIRIYKEDPDEETWTLVAKDRDGLVGLINELNDGSDSKISSESTINEDSNSLAEKPIIDTGQIESSNSSDTKKSDDIEDDSNESKKVSYNNNDETKDGIVDDDDNAIDNVKPSLKRQYDDNNGGDDDGKIVKKTKIDSELSETIEEPVMLIKGDGLGCENKCGVNNPIVSETIEEPVMYIYGVGGGLECQTGNDGKSDSDASSNTQLSEKCNNNNNNNSETDTNNYTSINKTPSDLQVIDNSRNNNDKSPVKNQYKLGTIIDTKTDNNKTTNLIKSTNKKSRWDVETITISTIQQQSTIINETDEQSNPTQLTTKPIFFFGPGCLPFKTNTISSATTTTTTTTTCNSATIEFGQKVPESTKTDTINENNNNNENNHQRDTKITESTKDEIDGKQTNTGEDIMPNLKKFEDANSNEEHPKIPVNEPVFVKKFAYTLGDEDSPNDEEVLVEEPKCVKTFAYTVGNEDTTRNQGLEQNKVDESKIVEKNLKTNNQIIGDIVKSGEIEENLTKSEDLRINCEIQQNIEHKDNSNKGSVRINEEIVETSENSMKLEEIPKSIEINPEDDQRKADSSIVEQEIVDDPIRVTEETVEIKDDTEKLLQVTENTEKSSIQENSNEIENNSCPSIVEQQTKEDSMDKTIDAAENLVSTSEDLNKLEDNHRKIEDDQKKSHSSILVQKTESDIVEIIKETDEVSEVIENTEKSPSEEINKTKNQENNDSSMVEQQIQNDSIIVNEKTFKSTEEIVDNVENPIQVENHKSAAKNIEDAAEISEEIVENAEKSNKLEDDLRRSDSSIIEQQIEHEPANKIEESTEISKDIVEDTKTTTIETKPDPVEDNEVSSSSLNVEHSFQDIKIPEENVENTEKLSNEENLTKVEIDEKQNDSTNVELQIQKDSTETNKKSVENTENVNSIDDDQEKEEFSIVENTEESCMEKSNKKKDNQESTNSIVDEQQISDDSVRKIEETRKIPDAASEIAEKSPSEENSKNIKDEEKNNDLIIEQPIEDDPVGKAEEIEDLSEKNVENIKRNSTVNCATGANSEESTVKLSIQIYPKKLEPDQSDSSIINQSIEDTPVEKFEKIANISDKDPEITEKSDKIDVDLLVNCEMKKDVEKKNDSSIVEQLEIVKEIDENIGKSSSIVDEDRNLENNKSIDVNITSIVSKETDSVPVETKTVLDQNNTIYKNEEIEKINDNCKIDDVIPISTVKEEKIAENGKENIKIDEQQPKKQDVNDAEKKDEKLSKIEDNDSDNSDDLADNRDPLNVSGNEAEEEEEQEDTKPDEVKPKPALSLTNFSLDFTETPTPTLPLTRSGLRKRGHESVETIEENENQENDSKRIKIRGKRNIDTQLRKSIEEQKNQILISSDDDGGGGDDNDVVIINDDKNDIQPGTVTVKPKKRPKRKGGKKKKKKAKSATKTDEDGNIIETKRITNPANKNKRLLQNLGINLDLQPEIEIGPVGVRQSRRIAQLKIKEEAERRKLEEEMSKETKETQKKKKRKSDDKDYKGDKRKIKTNSDDDDDDDEADNESEQIDKKKKKRKKDRDPRKLFDEFNPWKSSSGSSSSTENDDDDEEIVEEEDEQLHYVSDHEFSPESDLEGDGEAQPLKRARTARKESEDEEEVDDCPCQKCKKSDHPEWILLCDQCDNGWHCSCLRPPLLVIPEGDWFCPPCQHARLLQNLQDKLVDYDKKLNKKENEDRRKERLAYVGISLNNVLPSKETERIHKKKRTKPINIGDDNEDDYEDNAELDDRESSSDDEESGDSESESESDSSDSDEPIYQLRQRRQAHSYRFNDYDDLINSAIQDEMEAVKGAGNQGRGKDITTIVNAEKEDEELKKVDDTEIGDETREIPPESELPPLFTEENPEIKTVDTTGEIGGGDDNNDDDDDDEIIRPVKKRPGQRKKTRKLNALDISSADDEDSDEDFKGTSSDSDEDFDDEELGSEDSDDLDSGRGGRRRSTDVRRSTRARTSRYDADFIDDDSEDDAPRRKKKKSIWDESESEESDRSWGRRKRKPVNRQRKSNTTTTKKKKLKKKKKCDDDSDAEVYKKKKPKIKFGLDGDEVNPGRRTRGKKINYVDALGSDSDEDRVKRPPPRIESEEEYVANEEDDLDEDDKISEEDEGNSSEELRVNKTKIDIKTYTHPLPSSTTTTNTLNKIQEDDVDDEPNPIDVINKNLEEMDENEMEKMMEEEEYANKQLQLVALQIEKEKKRKEREAKKMEAAQLQQQSVPPPQPPVIVPPVTVATVPVITTGETVTNSPKKRGRKPKGHFQFAQTVQDPIVGNMENLIINTENNEELSEPPGVSLPLFRDLPNTNDIVVDEVKKRRGRAKKSIEEAVANLGGTTARQQDVLPPPPIATKTAFLGTPTDLSMNQENSSNIEIAAPPQPFSQSQPTPSVITRMLQNKPGQSGYPVGTIRPKQFATMPERGDDEITPSPPPPPHHYMTSGIRPQMTAPPFRQLPSTLNHYQRSTPPTSPHQIRNTIPQTIPSHIYHSHRTLDPSPSGGGAINMSGHNSPNRVASPASASPSGGSTSSTGKNETPPPSQSPLQYTRTTTVVAPPPPPQINRFPIVNSPRHMQHIVAAHIQPPRSNMSPYHPNIPPSYHYSGFPPPPPPAAPQPQNEDALPPTVYQPPPQPPQYNEQYTANENHTINQSENSNNSKSFDEESGGEFGGLVSYFSSQREDDLES